MILKALVHFALATAAIATPLMASSLNSTQWTPDHVLQPDEVILYGNGRMEVVHENTYHALLASQEISLDVPEVDDTFRSIAHSGYNKTHLRARADCSYTTAVVTDRSETFIDWDVQMSPVVIGTGNGIDVYVSSGFAVSNSIGVSAGIDWKVIKDKLGVSLGIDYSHTWTTQTVINIKGTVPNGYSGCMITKPIKTRRFGRVLNGCIGSQVQTGTFQADSYQEGSYAGVKWVSGAITMCTKQEFPLSRCNGLGDFT
ncbi:hypothetical protein N7494_010466 [Penicillium frequentans]|uniref:Uncharacterized protein n=1 Tax=Penicillium frequentans TaxID=3151616 RepID=A0AAD6CIE9_9EURO|nr:hypothetical protein N7494_010466 [Penicillium glabrum]